MSRLSFVETGTDAFHDQSSDSDNDGSGTIPSRGNNLSSTSYQLLDVPIKSKSNNGI